MCRSPEPANLTARIAAARQALKQAPMFQTFESQSERGAATERIKELRRLMAAAKLDAYLIPRADEYQGEYVPAVGGAAQLAHRLLRLRGPGHRHQEDGDAVRRRPLHGAGARRDRAGADRGLRASRAATSANGWPSTCRAGRPVGFDPRLHTIAEVERLEAALKPHGIKLSPDRPQPRRPGLGPGAAAGAQGSRSCCTRRSLPGARRRTRSPTSRSA